MLRSCPAVLGESPPFLWLIPVVLVVVIAGIGGIIYLIARSARSNVTREKALPALASNLGLRLETGTFYPGVPPFEATGNFALFRSKDTPSMTNVLHGRLGNVDTQLFDYTYFTRMGVGKDRESTPTHYWVAMLTAEGFWLPASIDVTPQNFLDRIAASLGQQTITFAEYPELSRLYVFGSFDERFMRALFDPAMAAWFAQHPGLCVHGDGRHLVVYRPERLTDPAVMRAFVDEAMAVFQMIAAGSARVASRQPRPPVMPPPPLPA